MEYIKGCFNSCCNKITKYKEPEINNKSDDTEKNNNIDANNKKDNKKNNKEIKNYESKTNDDNTNKIILSGNKNIKQRKTLEEILKDLNLTGNNNNDEWQKPTNNLEGKDDKKDAKNKDKKAENKDLNKKSKDKNKKTENINKNKNKGNINIQPLPSQIFEQTKETDKHLHNFLTRIVIKICKLEKSFCENNNGNCSQFWKNLVGGNNETFETKDTLFTTVLNRNYNHHNICDNNHILRLLRNNFMNIKGKPETSEIVNQMVQQKSCEQLERLLRISNEDKNKLKDLKPQCKHSLGDKTLQDPMTPTINDSPINKSTEIMLMLMNIQDVAFDIYRKSSEKEKQHAKNILLFFRQVLTTLYEKKIISVLDERSILKQVDFPMNNKKYWQQLSSQQQIKQEKSFINFNLNKDTKEIEKIELEKLFWKNGAQYKGVASHNIQDEMKYRRQCINERTDFALNSSVVLDDEKNL